LKRYKTMVVERIIDVKLLKLSLHFRGPLWLRQLAVYFPSPSANSKRSVNVKHHDRHHGHQYLHRRGPKNAQHKEQMLAERAVGDLVSATINGKLAFWTNEYAGSTAAVGQSSSVASAAPSQGSAAMICPYCDNISTTTTISDSAAETNPASLSTVQPPSPSDGFGQTEASRDTGLNGSWTRQGYYNSEEGVSDGLTFLNHFGGTDGMPGTADGGPAFGASLSYASCDGKSAAHSPQMLSNKMLEDNVEVIVLSNQTCSDGDCGYTRPGGVAYRKFNMTGFNADMPAIWALNAQIPLTSQYGTNPSCSCILDTGDSRCKSTLHMAPPGGSSDYFPRPTDGTIKAAVVFVGAEKQAHIQILDNDQSFDESLASHVVDGFGSDDGNPLSQSVFRLAG
ncbi:MAG: hypothetical protein Q9214_006805, partial [Letrouitia sp. 1 TL-2023]